MKRALTILAAIWLIAGPIRNLWLDWRDLQENRFQAYQDSVLADMEREFEDSHE